MPDLSWLERARVVIVESYWPPLYPDLECDAERLVATLRAVNANAVRFGTIGYWANYPTAHFPVHPELGERDVVAEVVDACHRAGQRFIAYVPLSHPMTEAALAQRPQWAQRDLEGHRNPFTYHAGDRGRPFLWRICSRGPYRAVAQAITQEIVERYEVDAVYFDGPQYYTPCYCEGCQASFRAHTGAALPAVRRGREHELDWQDPLVRAYWRWVADVDHEVLREQVETIRSRRDVPVLAHGSSVLHRPYKQPHERLLSLVDGALFEMGDTYLHRQLVATLTRSTGKLMWSYTGTYNNHPRLFGQGQEWALEGFGSLAAGGCALVAAGGRLYYDTRGAEHVRIVYDFQAQHAETYAGLTPTPFLALPYSQATAEGCGRDDPHQRYNRPWAAAWTLLQHANVQVTPVFEGVLGDGAALGRFAAVYLPNASVLDAAHVARLRAYVEAGGALIAAGAVATHDAAGRPLARSALAGVLGVALERDVWIGHDTYLRAAATPHEVLAGLGAGDLLPVQRHSVGQATPEAKVLATLQRGGRDTGQPALVVRELGKGRVVYFAGAPEDAYVQWLYRTDPTGNEPVGGFRMGYDHLPAVRDLLAAAVRWAVRGALPFELSPGPDPGLLTVLAEKPGLQLLSLVNLSGPRYEMGRCVVPYSTPRRDLLVRLRTPARGPVRLLRAGREAPAARVGEFLEVTVPALEDYEAVAVYT